MVGMTLMQADDFRGDWYGYVCNQAGHAAIVGFRVVVCRIGGLPMSLMPGKFCSRKKVTNK